VLILFNSGVSSKSAVSAGDDSAPDASEKMFGSNGFRGVVNNGLRNWGEGVELVFVKELVGLLEEPKLKFAVCCQVYVSNIHGVVQLTFTVGLRLELGKRRVWISRSVGRLPFPIHRTFMRSFLVLEIVEHIYQLVFKAW
jgi:hypothetical protein